MVESLRRWGYGPGCCLAPRVPGVRGEEKKPPSGGPGWCVLLAHSRSGLLRFGFLLAEIIVVRHAPAHIRVEVPAHGALGEGLLRRDDLDEQRVVLPLVHDRIED